MAGTEGAGDGKGAADVVPSGLPIQPLLRGDGFQSRAGAGIDREVQVGGQGKRYLQGLVVATFTQAPRMQGHGDDDFGPVDLMFAQRTGEA